jgi:hypothetical protein
MILSGQIKLTNDFIISFNKTPAYHKIKKKNPYSLAPVILRMSQTIQLNQTHSYI